MGTGSSGNQFNENIKTHAWLFSAHRAPHLCSFSDLKNGLVKTAKCHSFICPVALLMIHGSSAVAILILIYMVFSVISTWCLVHYSFGIINCCACKRAARTKLLPKGWKGRSWRWLKPRQRPRYWHTISQDSPKTFYSKSTLNCLWSYIQNHEIKMACLRTLPGVPISLLLLPDSH